MILAQTFKTSDGAHKRCAFENAHRRNPGVTFSVVRFLDGKRDTAPFSRDAFDRYTWRLEKTGR